MKMMNRYILGFLIAAVSMSACRSTKKIGSAIAHKDSAQVVAMNDAHADSVKYMRELVNRVQANRISVNTFAAKMNVDYRDGSGKNYDLNATIRMQKDSAIWVSANAVLGIEAMRALITKDSVKIMDKLNKTYTARSLDFLQEVSGLPLNLSTLQDLILGNPVYLDSNLISYSRTGNTVSVLNIGDLFKNLLAISEVDAYLQFSKLNDLNPARNRTADLVYTDYEDKKGRPFATKRRITISEAKKLEVKLDFKQYDFETEVSFPFSVPRNYKRN